jgi:hypothetical protein
MAKLLRHGCKKLQEMRELIANLPPEDRIEDVSDVNLIRFLRVRKFVVKNAERYEGIELGTHYHLSYHKHIHYNTRARSLQFSYNDRCCCLWMGDQTRLLSGR